MDMFSTENVSDAAMWLVGFLTDLRDMFNGITDWLLLHEDQADRILVWSLFICYAALALVKVGTWHIMKIQRDRTRLGRALKRQYMAEIFKNAGQSALYGVIILLDATYPDSPINVWERMGIRIVVVVSIVFAVIFNVILNRVLGTVDTVDLTTPDRPVLTNSTLSHGRMADNRR
jgi:hypothetical protein